jgi:hypothetical protein
LDLAGEVLIWANDGRLAFLEQSWFTDSPPTKWPRLQEVELAVNHVKPARAAAVDALLVVPIPGKDGWVERLRCVHVDNDTYEVGCNPFLLEGISIGDHVVCPSSLGPHDDIEAVSRGSASSWRRSFPDSTYEWRTEVSNALARRGADVEWWHVGGLISASCGDASHATAIADYLDNLG